ncbi:MAG: Crp/Fnr family transcriptional regulator [Deltaproteobacteria bacterium]|nr:Crp/Fnr family transcriptional regulator [Deltaproteobacteria bacterium]
MKLIDQIARLPLFQGLAPKQMEDLAMILVDQVFKRGQSIFSEEDEGEGLYIIISGRVKIFKLSPDGKEQILHIFGPGEPFGEVAVFTGRRFPANAEALEETRAFFFPRTEFVNLIRKDPSLALNMLAELSSRLRKFTTLVENLALKEIPGRLAAYILVLSERKKGGAGLIDLDISKNQLASLLGTIPETLSRILARMEKEQLIKSERKRITILDRNGLEELSIGERKLP